MSSSENAAKLEAQRAGADPAQSDSSAFATDDGEMLRPDPPPLIIRGTAWLLIAIFAVVFLASVLVHFPETVRCSFVLVPEHGADPIQSPLLALVQAVKVTEGQ